MQLYIDVEGVVEIVFLMEREAVALGQGPLIGCSSFFGMDKPIDAVHPFMDKSLMLLRVVASALAKGPCLVLLICLPSTYIE